MSDALVIYSNTGRRLMFDSKDVVLPAARFAELKGSGGQADKDGDLSDDGDGGGDPLGVVEGEGAKSDAPHVSQWFVKQWDAMKGYYMSRLWKEDALQKLSLEEFTDRIADAVERRWHNHKARQAEAKKRKRQREAEALQKADRKAQRAIAAAASRALVVTNIIALESFAALDLMRRGAVWDAIGALVLKQGAVAGSDVVVDETPLASSSGGDAEGEGDARCVSKGPRTEEAPPAVLFDDRLALRVVFVKAVDAAKAVAVLNGHPSPADGGRRLLCELIPMEAVGLGGDETAPAETGGNATHTAAGPMEKSFMDLVDEEIAQANAHAAT